MPCPVCDRTMQNVGATTDRIFWCPTCGTLRTVSGDHTKDEPPSFIRRVIDMSVLSRNSAVTAAYTFRETETGSVIADMDTHAKLAGPQHR